MFSAGLSESQLEAALTARGSNYSLMKCHHMTHKANEGRLVREAPIPSVKLSIDALSNLQNYLLGINHLSNCQLVLCQIYQSIC